MVRSLTAVIGNDDPTDIGFELPCQRKVSGQVFQCIASVQGPTPEQKAVLRAKRFPFQEFETKLPHFFGRGVALQVVV